MYMSYQVNIFYDCEQSSKWTFQATRMVGYVTENFSIKPDQLQVRQATIFDHTGNGNTVMSWHKF